MPMTSDDDRRSVPSRPGRGHVASAILCLLSGLLLVPAACDGAGEATDAGAGGSSDDAASPECTAPEACPAPPTPCGVATCHAGRCGIEPAGPGTVCRAAAGLCDIPEVCDGASTLCPPDTFAPAGIECRPATGPCDVPEACYGFSAACPDDAFVSAGVACRPATGPCDAVEACDGAGPACPADAPAPAGSECRAIAGMCDAAEVCDGDSLACPADTGTAVLCQPEATTVHRERGRVLTVTDVDLHGTGSRVATALAGTSVTLRVQGSWGLDLENPDCPGCITQFYARLNGVFSLCLGSTTGSRTFDLTTTFTAPSAPGVYAINPTSSWETSCVAGTAAPTAFSESSIAVLIVI